MMDPSAVPGSSPSVEIDHGVASGRRRLAPGANDSSNSAAQAATGTDQSDRFSERLNKARSNAGDDPPAAGSRSATVADNPVSAERTDPEAGADAKVNAAASVEDSASRETEPSVATASQASLEELSLTNGEVLAQQEEELLSELNGAVAVADIDGQPQTADAQQLKGTPQAGTVAVLDGQPVIESDDNGLVAIAPQNQSQQTGNPLTATDAPDTGELPLVTQQTPLSDQVSRLFKRSAAATAGDQQVAGGIMRRGVDPEAAANATLINARETPAAPLPVMDDAVLEEAQVAIKENATTRVVTTRVERMAELEAAMQTNGAANVPAAKTVSSLLSGAVGVPHNINTATLDQPLDSSARTAPVPGTNPNAAAAAARELPALPAFAGDNIRLMLQQGLSRATLMLHPAELGALKINLDVQSEQLNVQIVASQSATRDALEQSLPKMRAQLQQGGFGDVNIDLSNGHTESQQQRSDQTFQFSQSDSSLRDSGFAGMPSQASMSDMNVVPVRPVSMRLVDLFA